MTTKYNFVIDSTNLELVNYLKLRGEDGAAIFTRGDLNWCLQSFLILSKRNNLQVECSNCLKADAINLVHSDQLLKLKGSIDKFIVCIRADYPKRRWAQYHVVQNKNQLSFNTSFIPHWVQPGLIKRDPMREGVLRVAYSGQVFNGNLAGSENAWKTLFEPHGIEFVALTAGAWHNLSSIDVLIAIRSFDTKPHNSKPPTKLFSAWHAKIPLVAGYDSAFMQMGTPREDYLLVKTPEEAVSAVLKLRDEPALYKRLVENGSAKAALYNEDTIAKQWEEILTKQIKNRYEKWKSNSALEKIKFNFLLNLGLAEHQSKQIIKRLIS
jgi:hypothetical protein